MVEQDIVQATVVKQQETSENERFLYLKHSEFHSSTGIASILTFPTSLKFPSGRERILAEAEFGFPQHKLVLLVHGHSAHKNTVYMPLLAQKLADMGYYVLRIDFRNMGDSEPNRDPKVGRTIAQDCEDLETVYQFAGSSQCQQLVGHCLVLDTIVAHSRGVMSMFEFARQRFVPNLINCCGRFVAWGLFEKSRLRNPNWDAEGGFKCEMLRYGKMQELWIPKPETVSAATVDTTKFADIDPRSWVMSIYGSKDSVIPLSAFGQYSNLFQGRHTAEMIMDADHNFYGLPGDPNAMNLPLRKGLINYNVTTVELISAHLSPEKQLQRFYETTKFIQDLSNPSQLSSRWPLPYSFSNVSNFRDIGGYKTRDGYRVKPKVLYRCANPSEVTDKGIKFMKEQLHVTRIFDLRSTKEAAENGVISGIDVENLAFNQNVSAAPEELARLYRGLLLSSYMFPEAYQVMMQNSIPQIRRFCRYIINEECDELHAAVFHCAAGKDRTGILAVLILGLLGVDDDTIAHDYEMTSLGLQTEKRLKKAMEDRGDRYYEMLGSKDLARDYQATPMSMCKNLLSSKYEAMRLFLDHFRSVYGSFDSFYSSVVKLSGSEIKKLKEALLEPQDIEID
ncbi:uncharacterized protein KLTH0D13992g [Lachancea thermotolerans CBS 6340]|uniref:KLTH0D13992p n=1 Tax=Lachancea thermotolerans (strain ATCC 56472 / CBS 6340 / NRRL Y-8284) TaxID=559295 RepID=C5DFC4_LACTC|nr:KLTH0D13992p [Lachancea thermotolerans CBS 6340]CAR22879.1 KLTH0D13992p [Lachancea thermotolerans CBS 6340]